MQKAQEGKGRECKERNGNLQGECEEERARGRVQRGKGKEMSARAAKKERAKRVMQMCKESARRKCKKGSASVQGVQQGMRNETMEVQ